MNFKKWIGSTALKQIAFKRKKKKEMHVKIALDPLWSQDLTFFLPFSKATILCGSLWMEGINHQQESVDTDKDMDVLSDTL